MIKAKDYARVDPKDAQEIRDKIKQEADAQVEDIINSAKKEAESLIALADQEAAEKRSRMLKDMERDIARDKEKILSTLSIEKKRISLEARDKLVQDILSAVEKCAQDFRNSKEYDSFMRNAIVEGASIIDEDPVDVYYSPSDERMMNDSFVKETSAYASNKLKKPVSLRFHKGDFKDIGVTVSSQDGHLEYDNRFGARMSRAKDEIYVKLLREAF